jgi:uncharacterized protein YndB with AHSA1/START domain
MKSYDWSQFTQRIPISAGVETLYQAWATRKGLEHWFLRKAQFKNADGKLRATDEELKAGDTYEWMWFGYPDSVVEHGEILEANGANLFSFSFGKAGKVTVRFYSAEGMTVVEVTQTEIPTDEEGKVNWHIGCTTGWLFYLVNLKSLYEGGHDLRNRNEKLMGMLNA